MKKRLNLARGILLAISVSLVAIVAIVTWKSSGASGDDPPDKKYPYDAAKFDTRLSVAQDGNRICRSFSRKGMANLCEARNFCQQDAIAEIEKQLLMLRPEDRNTRLDFLERKAEVLTYKEDRLLESLEAFRVAYDFALTFNKERALDILAKTGMIQMRLGEIKNCIENHNSDSCIFPLSKLAQHIDKTGSLRALELFSQYLKDRPGDEHIRWLVNVLHMTLGTYPKGVPKELLITFERMQSESFFPEFRNIAPEIGVHVDRNVGGAVADDFNNDGFVDLMFGSLYPCDSVIYLQFDPKENRFVDRTIEAGFQEQRGVGLILQADFDNDGDLDVYLTRGSWHPGGTETPAWGGFQYNSILKNDGAGKFTDVTESVGLRGDPNSSLSANWGDVNNDGWLDLYVSNESRTPDLYINRKGKFTNEIKRSRIINNSLSKGSMFTDFNNDGNLDLIFTSLQGPKKVYLGKGNGVFTFSKDFRIPQPENSFPVVAFDYDQDGFIDLFIGSFAPDVANFSNWLQGKPVSQARAHRLFRNVDGKSFSDVTEEVGLYNAATTMSLNVGDLDGNGFPDLYLGTGAGSFGDLEPNRLFSNIDGKKFDEVTIASRMGSLQKGHGISMVDLNHDGLLDVVLEQAGLSHSDRFFVSLFKNEMANSQNKLNSWIKLKLVGSESNRDGLHSRIKISIAMENGGSRTVHATSGNSGSFGSNPLVNHIGLGRAKNIEQIEIQWHGSGLKQSIRNVSLNSYITVREGESNFVVNEYAPFEFSLAKSGRSHQH